MASAINGSADLTLHRLSRRWIFRVAAEFHDGAVSLSPTRLYRVVSAMADSGRTIVIEEVICGDEEPGRYNFRWDDTIRIRREAAKAIAVYRVQ